MRIIGWFVQTLFYRSWLIIGGILLGILARYAFPDNTPEMHSLPTAAENFQQIHQFDSDGALEEELGNIRLDRQSP